MKSSTGIHAGKILALPKMPCGTGDDTFPIDGFKRVQFPIRVCFGFTTKNITRLIVRWALGLDMREECFTHGQLYVDLSRTTHPRNFSVLTRNFKPKTKNKVHRKVLC